VHDLIEGGGSGAAEAYDEAVRRADETMAALRRRLPGKLWVDRYANARPTRASQHGPLLALLVRLGEKAVPLLGELLANEDRELRYYATLACVEVRNAALVAALVPRLFDQDYGVRGAAVDALSAYPSRDTDPALQQVRNALHGDAARARAAAHALGELRDVGSVLDLIATTERDHTTAEEARRALIQLTKQDFGTKARKWRSWWEKNHDRPRMEWLLDGLAHADDEVRLSASEELKRMTGEYFGYHYDLPKREREEARAKWVKWWEEIGKRRFLRDGIPEAERPTAMLPHHPPKRS
jgi:HEAT repeat protein